MKSAEEGSVRVGGRSAMCQRGAWGQSSGRGKGKRLTAYVVQKTLQNLLMTTGTRTMHKETEQHGVIYTPMAANNSETRELQNADCRVSPESDAHRPPGHERAAESVPCLWALQLAGDCCLTS